MAGADREKSGAKTKLARVRLTRGVTQIELANRTGLSLKTIQRLERGQNKHPNLRQLVNCALILDCRLQEVIEEEWREWSEFRREAPAPEGPRGPRVRWQTGDDRKSSAPSDA